jgi:(2Fe-2S) ferredoxin
MSTLDPQSDSPPRQVLVCKNCPCVDRDAAQVLEAFKIKNLSPNTTVEGLEYQGQCSSGPTVRIVPEETWYYLVQPQDVEQIVTQHLHGGEPVTEKLHPRIHPHFSF